ncbi:cupin domain-containing protein [Nocardia sp. NPDC088792]|uniref:cupin domain-containing protein n=1 Tax=Nocardia sp. NPDC088792 TaxID=3364332 RepID=UPI0037FDA3A8
MTAVHEITDTEGTQFDLTALLAPISPETFRAEYWERQPLLVRRDDPGHYDGFLTLDDIDAMISMAGAALSDVMVVSDGKTWKPGELAQGGRDALTNSLAALYERYRAGSTVVLNYAHDRWEPLQRSARRLGTELGALVRMNIYLTPPGSRGFKPHYDRHDVFVVQVHGSKQWQLGDPPYELPLHELPFGFAQEGTTLDREIELNAGDLLYLPRGTLHTAATGASASAHVTLGVHPVIWGHVLADAVQDIILTDARFRGGLPAGFTRDDALRDQVGQTFAELVEVLRERLTPHELTARAAHRATSNGSPALRHQLLDLERAATLDADTPVRRRPDTRSLLTETAAGPVLRVHHKAIPLSAPAVRVVRHAESAAAEWFSAAAISDGSADYLDAIRTLVSDGFLTLH